MKIKNIVLAFFLIIPVLYGSGIKDMSTFESKYTVKIKHPGKLDVEFQELDLIGYGSKLSPPDEYYMDVPSVYCHDSVCTVVFVRMFWNNIGEYQRFKLNSDVWLEKVEGKEFSEADYKKLHQILSDKNSIYKEVSIDDLLNPISIEGVDAVTGATMLTLKENETVKGAALSCYTLWHFANGNIVSEIQKITRDACNEKDMESYLRDGDLKRKSFALQSINKKGFYTKSTVDAVIKQSLDNNELFKTTINYFESANSEIYYPSVAKLFKSGSKSQRLEVLYSLKRSGKTPIVLSFFDELCKQVSKLKSYQELDLFLEIIEDNGVFSEKIEKEVSSILSGDVLLARRAFWYLKKQNLSESTKVVLKDFQLKNQAYL